MPAKPFTLDEMEQRSRWADDPLTRQSYATLHDLATRIERLEDNAHTPQDHDGHAVRLAALEAGSHRITLLESLSTRLAALEAGVLAHSAEHAELNAAIGRIHEAVPQSAEVERCAGCRNIPVTHQCAGREGNYNAVLCATCADNHRTTCGSANVTPLTPPEAPTPDERDRWLPRPQCYACPSEDITRECSRCGDHYCYIHQEEHTRECWAS